MWGRLTILISFVLVSGLVLTSVAGAADPSLVGWWKLDETSGTTAVDSSGAGNNGTLMGSPQWVAGQLGGALQLNGTSQYVDCGNSASLNLATQVTLSAWIKQNTAGNGAHQVFVAKGDNSYALKHNTGNYMEFNVYDGAWYTARGPVVTAAAWNGVWHHVAGTYEGTTLQIYVDGTLQPPVANGTQSHVGRIATSATSVAIGRDSGGSGRRYYNGTLDDVRIYNRAFSEGEVRYLAGDR